MAVALFGNAPAHSAEVTAKVVSLPLATGVVSLQGIAAGEARAVVLRDQAGAWFKVGMDEDGRLTAVQTAIRPAPAPVRANMLPDGVVSAAIGTIRAAWLTGPTRRYGHGVLGDLIEASGLAVETGDGRMLSLQLDNDAVFEDRLARIVDLDGDGSDQILVVKSYLEKGAAPALYRIGKKGLERFAEAAAIGRPNRWLNPVGVADFDGDGRNEIAVVRTPHIGGQLLLYQRDGDTLRIENSANGFSNHSIGSRELGLSAMLDANGDGVTDIVLPDAAQGRLRAVTFADGHFRELAKAPIEGALGSALVTGDLDGDGRDEVVFVAGGARLWALSFASK